MGRCSVGYVGMRVSQTLALSTERLEANLEQYCRICHEGASATGRQYSQQPKPHGKTRLCSRGM